MTRKRAGSLAAPTSGGSPAVRQGPSRVASLVVVYGTELGRRLPLAHAIFTIGRSTKCDLPIDQEAVSRQHAKIVREGGRYTLIDLRSSNGTRVNDERVLEHVLQDGDRVRVGQTLLVFLNGENIELRFQEEIYRLMTHDGLTSVYNKRFFTETLGREHARALRYARRLSLILLDVDGFDQLHRDRGPLAADALLQQIAAAVSVRLRQQDIFGRVDEGTFGVILPEIDLEGARAAAEKARVVVAEAAKAHDGVPIACTLSVGVASLTESMADPGDLFAAALAALDAGRAPGGDGVADREGGA